jgi:hypothetical protein
MTTIWFLLFRLAHVLVAATWVGATIFTSTRLMPAIEQSGPAGGQLMATLEKRGLVPFFASLAGTTVLTGIILYWRFTSGFDPTLSQTHAGIAFGVGGVAGILALIFGAIVGRGSSKLVNIMGQVAAAPEAKRSALLEEANAIRGRVVGLGKLVILCQVIALSLMAVGHYI